MKRCLSCEREAFKPAVFYAACNFNCAFCQNWHYREDLRRLAPISPSGLASGVGGARCMWMLHRPFARISLHRAGSSRG